jgi:hypothetical protein
MKKILLSLFVGILALPSASFAQCVIDTTITQAIVPPAGSKFDTLANNNVIVILPYGNVNQSYSEVLQFRVPSDTNFAGIAGTVDSIKLMSILNLPSGMSLGCNPGSCVFEGGSYGCGELSGIPTTPDSIELSIAVEYTVTIGGASAPIKDTLGGFYLVIKGQVGSSEMHLTRPRVYPNPARDYIKISAGSMADSQMDIRIINLVGSEVFRRRFSGSSAQPMEISTASLKPGVYLYQIRASGQTFSGKFSIAR